MKGVLYIRDKDGNFVPIPALKGDKGDPGESPYAVAQAYGYTGTEEELNKAVAELVETKELAKGVQSHMNSHSNNKDNPHGVTAAQIGAVKKSGDTVNGNLNVNGALAVERSDNNRKARTVVHNNEDKEVDVQNYTDDSNYVGIRLATEEKGAGDAVNVVQMKNGKFSSFPVLHTGNKEKIFTSGTEDLTAGSSPLGNGQLYFVYELE